MYKKREVGPSRGGSRHRVHCREKEKLKVAGVG